MYINRLKISFRAWTTMIYAYAMTEGQRCVQLYRVQRLQEPSLMPLRPFLPHPSFFDKSGWTNQAGGNINSFLEFSIIHRVFRNYALFRLITEFLITFEWIRLVIQIQELLKYSRSKRTWRRNSKRNWTYMRFYKLIVIIIIIIL